MTFARNDRQAHKAWGPRSLVAIPATRKRFTLGKTKVDSVDGIELRGLFTIHIIFIRTSHFT